MSQSDPAQDQALLQDAAITAGKIAMQWFPNPGKVWDKGGNHPVTEADLAIDAHLRAYLLGARPAYGWLSEESKDDQSRLCRSRVFIVDPIDGTRAFIQGKPHFSISIAVVENGRPIAGAVFNPAMDEMFLASIDGGATLGGQPISQSGQSTLTNCNMIAHESLFRQKNWSEPWPDMHCEIRNSMAYRMALIASGKWDATITLRPKSDWDLAAADLIAQEAGAKVGDPNGDPFCYNLSSTKKAGVICASPLLFDLLRQRIERRKGHRISHG